MKKVPIHRRAGWLIWPVLLALLTACGGQPSSQVPTSAPASSAPATAAATSAPATSAPATAAATSAPATAAATSAPATAAATSAPATAAATSAASSGVSGDLTVFAAASLTDAFKEIADALKKDNPELNVTYNFAGSQQLADQIKQGAPADVFASANAKQMGVAIEAGAVVSGTQQTFVKNRLVVVAPKDNPAGVQGLKDLSKPGLKLVLEAKEVPAGQYSLDILDKATKADGYGETFKDDVLKNVVSYEDNVRSVLAKVTLGEADAGIVYTSDINGENASKVTSITIPDELNVIASYPIAPLKSSAHAAAAKAFVDYVLSSAGQQLLAKYGFIPVSDAAAAAGAAGPKGLKGTLNVFAAASLTEPFKAIAATLKQDNPDLEITYNFAGSNQLAEQINQGAPADVFASANAKQMGVVIDGGGVVSGTQRTFVRNRLVVVTPKDNPAKLATLADLAKPGIKLVLAAAAVPVGQYALDVFGKASKLPAYGESFSQTVTANVVSYEENVKAVLSKVALGEADAGIVYTSDAASAGDKVGTVDIPDEVNSIASYPIAALKSSQNASAAEAFVSYILSPAAQTVLAGYGFIPTTGTASGAAPGAQPLAISGMVDSPLSVQPADFKALKTIDIKATDKGSSEQTYSGVPILELLTKAGIKDGAKNVVFTGGDGYSATVALSDLEADKDAVIVADANGALRNIIPSQRPGTWVKGLVKIEVQ